jgi:hypothetical protein
MINVGNDRKISDVIHQRKHLSDGINLEWARKKGASDIDAP